MFPTDKNLAAQLAPSFHENMSSEKSHISYIFIITFLFFLKHFADSCNIFIAIFFSHISTRRTDATLQWRGHPVQFSSIKRINETGRAALPYSLTWMKFLNESSSHGRESSCNDRWLEYSLGKNVGGASSLTFDGRIDAPLDLLRPSNEKIPRNLDRLRTF